MVVTPGPVRQVAINCYVITFESSLGPDVPCSVYVNGGLSENTVTGEYMIVKEAGENVAIEVLDDSTTQPSFAFPGRATLGWDSVTGTDYYKIEEYYGGQWVTRAHVKDRSRPAYLWRSRYLEDVTTHQFKITPVGIDGNEGAPVTKSIFMVHHPPVPDVSYSYNEGDGKVTISEN